MTQQRKRAPRKPPEADVDVEAERNPALVYEEPDSELVEKTYRVTGIQAVRGTAPGETFTATLPLEQEEALLWGGHITIEKEA